jgi:hypothetical protein
MRFVRTRSATCVGVLLLVLAPVAAGAEGENQEAPPPVTTAPGVVLEQPEEELEVDFEGLKAKARYTGSSYVVSLRNPSAEARELELELGCVSWSGSLVARMGPMPSIVARETRRVLVAAGGTTDVDLGRDWPALPAELVPSMALDQAEMFTERVQRVQVLLRRPGTAEPVLPGIVPDPNVALLTPRRAGA